MELKEWRVAQLFFAAVNQWNDNELIDGAKRRRASGSPSGPAARQAKKETNFSLFVKEKSGLLLRRELPFLFFLFRNMNLWMLWVMGGARPSAAEDSPTNLITHSIGLSSSLPSSSIAPAKTSCGITFFFN